MFYLDGFISIVGIVNYNCLLRGNKIEVFKILNGYENIDPNICSQIKARKRTKGHNITLAKEQSRLDVRKYSFFQRTKDENK